MASDTVSERNDEADLALAWSGRWTLTYRILAVNVLTLAIFALSVLYLDAYREQLRAERIHRLVGQALMMERTLPMLDPGERDDLLRRVGKDTRARFRLYGPDGRLVEDSWRGAEPTREVLDEITDAILLDIRALLAGLRDEVPPDALFEPPPRTPIDDKPRTENR